MLFSAKFDHGRGDGFWGRLTDLTQLRLARPRRKALMSITATQAYIGILPVPAT
jgi:hypothetical protein